MWYLVHWNQRKWKIKMFTQNGVYWQQLVNQVYISWSQVLGTCVLVYKTLGWGWPQKITHLNTPLHMYHIKFLRMGRKDWKIVTRYWRTNLIIGMNSERYTMTPDPCDPWLTVIITVPCLLFLELGQARVQPVSRLFSVTAGRNTPLLEKKSPLQLMNIKQNL